MIVVDSSAFIEFYRPKGREDIRKAVAEALSAGIVAVNGIIQTEIVAFARSASAFEQLKQDFQAFHWFELDRLTFDKASEIGHDLRSSGVSVPATDLIIAASTVANNAMLYHLDHHFELIARHCDLDHRSFILR